MGLRQGQESKMLNYLPGITKSRHGTTRSSQVRPHVGLGKHQNSSYGDRVISPTDFYAGIAIITGLFLPHALADQSPFLFLSLIALVLCRSTRCAKAFF